MEAYLRDSRPEHHPSAERSGIRGIQDKETLSPLGRIMLENVALKPVLGLVKRFKELGLKLSHGYKVIEELVSLKLVRTLTIDGNRLYELTPEGKKALGKDARSKGRGGIEHRYFVEKVKEHYLKKEGFTFLEKDDIDLVVETVEKKMAIQMETGKSDIQANLMKLGKYHADFKYVLATNRETEVRIRELMKDLLVPDKENIHIAFAKDFLNNPPAL
jgi:DNA-binding PadR family transcriptional regulator